MNKSKFLTAAFLFLFLALIGPAQAGTKTWKTANTGDWFAIANWVEADYPRAGDVVVITNIGASVLLTNSPGVYFSSLTLSKTLIFSNWNTTLSATNITIQSGGYVTLPPAFTDTQMSNNVYLVCSNITIDANGSINVDQMGYSCGLTAGAKGYGPGGSMVSAGYGGVGYGAGVTYGSYDAPLDPGSGGYSGHVTYRQGYGGGAVRIQASGAVTVNGSISANGGPNIGWGSQAGSGGGIYITCNTLSGSGTISANGGVNGGGGGRIAVIYIPAAQGSIAIPSIQFSANGGSGFLGDLGTLYFPDNRFLTETVTHSGRWMVPGVTSWSPNSLTVNNAWIGFRIAGFQLRVTNDVTINGATARLEIGGNQVVFVNAVQAGAYRHIFSDPTGPVFTCGGNLILTNGGGLTVYAGQTNGGAPDYGALVTVTNDVYIGNGSWIYPVSHWTNGGAVLFSMNRLTIWTNGGFNATGAGYRGGSTNSAGFGPGGGGYQSGGGSYGGLGGLNCRSSTYGSPSAPISPGSGGGGYFSDPVTYNACGYPGGGAVRASARDRITVYGSILANGVASGNYPGSGSGGGIFLTCRVFDGSTNGFIQADGANSGWGAQEGGGGGRVAVIYNTTDQVAVGAPGVRFSVSGADGGGGGADIGTLYFPDTKLLTETLNWNGKLVIPGFTAWSPNNLTINNSWVGFRIGGFQLAVTNNITISGSSAKLELGGNMLRETAAVQRYYFSDPNGPTLSCGGNLTLTNAGRLYVYSGPTNTPGGYGGLVNVAGDLKIADTNSWIYPQSHPTNGGSVLFQVGNLLITTTNSGMDATSRGFANGYGPGATLGGGGGYGGFGGGGGLTYGSSNAPIDPGSGGNSTGTGGGGLVRVQAARTISVGGSILANAFTGSGPYTSGSGGGIYLSCRRFYGSANGLLSANGGNDGWGGSYSGGGGRIAVWRISDTSAGQIPAIATNGLSLGTPGTIVWGWLPPPGTWFVIH